MGRLGSGPRLVGRIWSGVRVSVIFLQKYPPGSVLRCPTAAENGGYDQGGCVRGVDLLSGVLRRARHKHFVVVLCEQRTTDAAVHVLDALRRPSQLCFSQIATRTVDNTVDLYAAKLDIRPESCFLPTPHALRPR